MEFGLEFISSKNEIILENIKELQDKLFWIDFDNIKNLKSLKKELEKDGIRLKVYNKYKVIEVFDEICPYTKVRHLNDRVIGCDTLEDALRNMKHWCRVAKLEDEDNDKDSDSKLRYIYIAEFDCNDKLELDEYRRVYHASMDDGYKIVKESQKNKKFMNISDAFNNIKKFKGEQYHRYEIIYAFEAHKCYDTDYEIFCIDTDMRTDINGEDCRIYEAYINNKDKGYINIYVNRANIIIDVEYIMTK